MNRLTIYSILLLFILFSSACQSLPKSQLPKELPKDLEIRFESSALYSDGDAKSIYRSITISGNQMKAEFSRCQKVKNVTLENQSVEYLYQLFVKSEFDLIKDESATNGKSEEGFEAIYLKAGNISKNVKNGNQFPLSEKDRKHFHELRTSISELAVNNIGLAGCQN